MELIVTTESGYKKEMMQNNHVYNSPEFCLLNQSKCECIHWLLFKYKHIRGGIILGERNGVLYSPFSAPFGGFNFLRTDINLQMINQCCTLLADYCNQSGLGIEIKMPPLIYNPALISKQISVFKLSGYNVLCADLNYAIELDSFQEYRDQLSRNARKNLNIALKEDYHFFKAETIAEKALAYDIIRENRAGKDYSLRMTKEQVMDTATCVSADFFILSLGDVPVASAILFQVTKDIMQVIYWGDKPGYSVSKPMNILPLKLVEYYKQRNIKILDIGPSSEEGIPNFGLCEFKEGIGCSVSLKYTFQL